MLCIFLETAAKTLVGPVEHRRLLGGPWLSLARRASPRTRAPASARARRFTPDLQKQEGLWKKKSNSPHLTGHPMAEGGFFFKGDFSGKVTWPGYLEFGSTRCTQGINRVLGSLVGSKESPSCFFRSADCFIG